MNTPPLSADSSLEPDHLALLSYWRNSLSDSSRVASGERTLDSAYEISIDEIRSGKVSKNLADDFFLREEYQKLDSSKGIPVIVFPYIYSSRKVHGVSSTISSVKRIAPLAISAILTRTGALIREQEARPPVFLRDFLEPNAHSVSFGSLDDCDQFYSSHPFQDAPWEETVLYAEELFLAVTGEAPGRFSLPHWELEVFGRLCEASDPVEARHILKLYNWLLHQPETETLAALRKGVPQRPLLSPNEEWNSGLFYRGHPNSSFPLAPSQRRMLYHFISGKEPDRISVVNGPPGTGKTTLIQSMVATLWVNAALNKEKCPIIFASSTSNQAVTNVNRAFDSIPVDQASPWSGRWLSLPSSYGVYFASDSAKAKLLSTGTHLQTYSRLPTRDHPAEHFASYYETPAGLLDGISEYLECANRSGLSTIPFASLSKVQDALHSEMVRYDSELRRIIRCLAELSEESGEFPSLHAFLSVANALKEKVEQAALSLDATVSEFSHWSTLQEKWRRHQKEEPWIIWLSQLFSSGKTARMSRDYSFIRECGLWDMFAHVTSNNVRGEVSSYIAEMLNTLDDEISKKREALDDLTQQSSSFIEKLQFFSDWCNEHSIDGDLDGIHKVLDTKYRHTLFQLATHYWESAYLLEVETLLDSSSGYKDGQSPEKLERHYRRLAKLAPCFVSTLHMLPKWCRTYFREESYLVGAIDLLIVDEAAQVSPEVGAAVCALATRVCTVGDCHQIEPVQVIPEALDLVNVRRYLTRESESDITQLSTGGFLASNGSLLTLAQKAAIFSTHPDCAPGFFLVEHRRCLPEIIAYCNELMYQGLLQPKRLAETLSHRLPPFGWMHCTARSLTRGGSHENSGEAELIARWIVEHSEKLRETYKAPLKEILAIITPFSAQVKVLKRCIARAGLGSEKITVGTLHAMQGAERPVILFSPTYGSNHVGSVFFARNPRLLNVAVSRAKDSFLVFGSMELFRSLDTATGLLGRYLFADVANELSPLKEHTPVYVDPEGALQVVTSLSGHRELLKEVFQKAREDVLIVSPFIAERALHADEIPSMIQSAVSRGVRVRIVADLRLNRNTVALKKCITLLRNVGAQVFLATSKGIHCKVVCRDSDLIASGSFNWLAAVRDPGAYQRFEVTFVHEGLHAAQTIVTLEDDLRDLVGSTGRSSQLISNM